MELYEEIRREYEHGAVCSGSKKLKDAPLSPTYTRPLFQVSERLSASHDSNKASESNRTTPIDGSSSAAKLTLILANTNDPLSLLRKVSASSASTFISSNNATTLPYNSRTYRTGKEAGSTIVLRFMTSPLIRERSMNCLNYGNQLLGGSHARPHAENLDTRNSATATEEKQKPNPTTPIAPLDNHVLFEAVEVEFEWR